MAPKRERELKLRVVLTRGERRLMYSRVRATRDFSARPRLAHAHVGHA